MQVLEPEAVVKRAWGTYSEHLAVVREKPKLASRERES